MDHQRVAIAGHPVRHNAGVRQSAANHAGEDITRLPVLRVSADRQIGTLSFPEAAQVGHTAMVDIAIGAGQAPDFGVGREIGCHVFMHQLLKVGAECIAECADHHICADASFAGNVAAGVIEPTVGGIIIKRNANLISRCFDQCLCCCAR